VSKKHSIFGTNLRCLNLEKSPVGFFKKNAGITRMLATDNQASGNEIHIKEPVKHGMHFKLIKILKTINTNLDSWDPGAREMYLSFSKRHPEIDMTFVLEDDQGIKSTVGSGNFKKGKFIE